VEFLNQLFIEAMAKEYDSQALTGTMSGTSPCSGILTAACGYSVVMGSGLTAFSSVTATHLSEMISKLKASVLPGAVFVMNPKVFHFVRTLKTSDGTPIYSPIGGAQSGTIWGHRVVQCDSAPSTSAANTAFIAFGNFSFFLLGDRLTTALALDPYGKFEKYQTRVRWVRRLAPKIGRADAFVRLLTAAS
jgi:HK97 family phage major capsid protein